MKCLCLLNPTVRVKQFAYLQMEQWNFSSGKDANASTVAPSRHHYGVGTGLVITCATLAGSTTR